MMVITRNCYDSMLDGAVQKLQISVDVLKHDADWRGEVCLICET